MGRPQGQGTRRAASGAQRAGALRRVAARSDADVAQRRGAAAVAAASASRGRVAGSLWLEPPLQPVVGLRQGLHLRSVAGVCEGGAGALHVRARERARVCVRANVRACVRACQTGPQC